MGATYKNQLVIFGGGELGKMAVNDLKLYIYNPKTRKWVSLSIQSSGGSSSPSARHGHVMISGSGDDTETIYMHGGMNDEQMFDDLWKIDMRKLCWSSLEVTGEAANRPCARAAHGGVSINSSLYVFGGLGQTGMALDDLWKYDTRKINLNFFFLRENIKEKSFVGLKIV